MLIICFGVILFVFEQYKLHKVLSFPSFLKEKKQRKGDGNALPEITRNLY